MHEAGVRFVGGSDAGIAPVEGARPLPRRSRRARRGLRCRAVTRRLHEHCRRGVRPRDRNGQFAPRLRRRPAGRRRRPRDRPGPAVAGPAGRASRPGYSFTSSARP